MATPAAAPGPKCKVWLSSVVILFGAQLNSNQYRTIT